MWTWTWSVVQRFVINEPLLIIGRVGFPMLLHSAYCAGVYTEACIHCMDPWVEMFMNVIKALTRV